MCIKKKKDDTATKSISARSGQARRELLAQRDVGKGGRIWWAGGIGQVCADANETQTSKWMS